MIGQLPAGLKPYRDMNTKVEENGQRGQRALCYLRKHDGWTSTAAPGGQGVTEDAEVILLPRFI